MIQLQRERLLAAGKGSRASAKGGSKSSKDGAQQQAKQTPQQRAADAIRSEDEQLGIFMQRISHRDDSREGSNRVPTVPTALSRRILNRQGAGFIDPTVAAAVSAAGDRFLVTVLHQAVACRDQRLKGAEVQREASLARKRHLDQVQADKDDRERRKAEKIKQREDINMEVIMNAEALTKKKGGAGASADKDGKPSPKSKKKKKGEDDNQQNNQSMMNGSRLLKFDRKSLSKNDDEPSVDSIDEEEEYYQRYYGDGEAGIKVGEEEEDDEALILWDLVHPLEAWQFTLVGKKGLLPTSKMERGDGRVTGDAQNGDDDEKPQEAGEEDNDEPESDEDGDADGLDNTTNGAAGNTGASNPSGSRKGGATSPTPNSEKTDPNKAKKSPAALTVTQQSQQKQRNAGSSSPVPL